MPQLEKPFTHAASHSPTGSIPPAPTMPIHDTPSSAQPLPTPPPLFLTQSWYSLPTLAHATTPLPAFTITHQRLPTTLPEQPSSPQSIQPPPPPRREPETTTIDLPEEVPSPPLLTSVNQPCHFHPSIMDDTGIFSNHHNALSTGSPPSSVAEIFLSDSKALSTPRRPPRQI